MRINKDPTIAKRKPFERFALAVSNFFHRRENKRNNLSQLPVESQAPNQANTLGTTSLHEARSAAHIPEIFNSALPEPENLVRSLTRQTASISRTRVSLQTNRQGQTHLTARPAPGRGSIYSSTRPEEPKLLLRNEVFCTLIVSYDQKQLDRLEMAVIKWNSSASCNELEAAAQRSLKEHGKDNLKQIYRKSGRCRLINDAESTQFSSKSLDDLEGWSETVALMVTSFWSQHPADKFHLEIQLDYSGLMFEREPKNSYADTIRKLIGKKMIENWEGKKFIPRKDLDAIMSEHTVAELISEDVSLRTPEFMVSNNGRELDKDVFTNKVAAFATRLLALYVYVDLPLTCLHKLIIQDGIEDYMLPLEKRNVMRPDPKYDVKWDLLLDIQGGFLALVFEDDKGRPQHRELKPSEVVPLIFHEKEDLIGEGSFGKVFEVSIDSNHHHFSNDKMERFALKRFNDLGSRTEGDFQNEARMLGLLSEIPHDHISCHLALWTQNNKFYMLFPRAEKNLKKFFKETPHPSLTKSNVLWLLSQLKGLADGVRQIHNLGPSGLGPALLNQKLKPAMKRGRTGFHHDLKPENILVFGGKETPRDSLTGFKLKISDFGSARIGLILSGSGRQAESYFTSNLSHGDAIYGAPDFALDRKTSRPYDLWSLGCIFLEFLMWTFGLNIEDFEIKRLIRPDFKGSDNQDSVFWYIDERSNVHLKPAVVTQLKDLKSHCEGMGVFKHLIHSISKLLTITPADRTDAPTLCNELDAMILQARVDLKNENYYLQTTFTPRGDSEVAAPPTTIGDNGSGSIDEGPVYAPHGQLLTPRPNHHRTVSTPLRPGPLRGGPVRPPGLTTSPTHQRSPNLPNGTRNLGLESVPSVLTQNLHPLSPRSRSPTISVSDYDFGDTPSPVQVNGVSSSGVFEPSPPVGWHDPGLPFRHDDFPLRRSRSRDSRGSFSSATFP